MLDKYDQTQVNLKRNDNYWGKTVFGTPAMTTINHPIFKSNNDGDLKLESGEIDASQQFTAQIWKMWEAGKPVSTWMKQKPYHVPGNIPFLIFNLNKPGLDNPKVRLAIAYGIDYPNIATTAMSDYSEPANASLIVPTGYESKFYDAAAVESEGWKFDPAKAVEILEGELKAKKGSDGIYELPDGTKLGGWKLITPTGWTDWNTACEIVAKSAKEIGIGISTEFPQAPTMYCQVAERRLRLAHVHLHRRQPGQPLDSLPRCIGRQGRTGLRQDRVLELQPVQELRGPGPRWTPRPVAKSDAEAKAAYAALDKIYRENVPVVPLMYRPLSSTSSIEQLGELPDRGEPIRSPHVAGRGHPVAVQDQEGWHLRLNLRSDAKERRRQTMALARYIGRKVAWTLVVFVVALLLNFLLPRLIPGNPVDAIVGRLAMGGGAGGEQLQQIHEHYMQEFGLDKPLWQQFFIYVGNVFQGDLGTSFAQLPSIGQLPDRAGAALEYRDHASGDHRRLDCRQPARRSGRRSRAAGWTGAPSSGRCSSPASRRSRWPSFCCSWSR